MAILAPTRSLRRNRYGLKAFVGSPKYIPVRWYEWSKIKGDRSLKECSGLQRGASVTKTIPLWNSTDRAWATRTLLVFYRLERAE